jgi:parallel beta-helix repeat protein
MSQRYVVANNVCRLNAAGGITIDPTLPMDHPDHDQIQDSYATVASNTCAANHGPGIHTTHAGYLAVHGNICDGNDDAGISLVSSRYAVIADNVLTGNSNGVGFFADASAQDVGHHLLGGNVYDKNRLGEIQFGPHHPAIRQLQDRWPRESGLNLPVKTTGGDPADPVDGLLYLNTGENKPRRRDWRTLTSCRDRRDRQAAGMAMGSSGYESHRTGTVKLCDACGPKSFISAA